MNTTKTKVHILDSYLFTPTNPITVNLIGAGGTGSQVLTGLARMNHALTALGHAGLHLRVWDDDVVEEANLGRQLFAEAELGLYKTVALVNRTNRFFGTNWKAETVKFERDSFGNLPEEAVANIYLSCVDTVSARYALAEILQELNTKNHYRNQPKYWMDFGNSQTLGQVILSTIRNIKQPVSQKFETVAYLPFVTEEFGELLNESENTDDTPSCSLADALGKQDLYINSTLSQLGCSLLWSLLRKGLTENRGFFLNLESFVVQPLKLS